MINKYSTSSLTKEDILAESPLRKLARSDKYQVLFSNAKELNNIYLFKNKRNFTKIQIEFLKWLAIYDSLYTDIQMGKEYINERVIEDPIRTEAYLLVRREKIQNRSSPKKTQKTNKRKQVHPDDIPTVVFE